MSGTYGLTCPDCGAQFNGSPGEDGRAVRISAGRAGWVLGHFDGEGQYACPDCSAGIYDPVRLDEVERNLAAIA